MKVKGDAIPNLQPPKSAKQCRQFFRMVDFLSPFAKDSCQHLLPIYDIQKKSRKFQWTGLNQTHIGQNQIVVD